MSTLKTTNIAHPSSASNNIVLDASGNVNIDSNTFYVDASNNRVGIGTTSPTQALHTVGNGLFTGTVDIGNETSGRKTLTLNSADNGAAVLFRADAATRARIEVPDGETALAFGVEIATTPTERMRIDSSGRLLVGTSSSYGAYPAVLQLQNNNGFTALLGKYSNNGAGPSVEFFKGRGGSASVRSIVQNGDELGILVFSGDDGTNGSITGAQIQAFVDGTPGANDMPGRLVFSVTADGASSPTERMRIMNGGGVYTFCSSTSDALNPATAAAAGTTRFLMTGAHSATGIDAGGTTAFRIYTNGNMQNINNSYAGISDVKLKENIVDAGSQWNDLKALQVRKYNFKEETGHETHTQIGLVAQEAELVSPGLVYETPDRDAEGNDLGTVTKSVNYSVLYMKAVKALQEAMERIEVLEQRLADAGIA